MPSQTKLIKQGIKYTDALFDEIIHRLEQGVLTSDTLEAFLEQTKDLTTSNPLVTSGYDNTLLSLILAETNNHKFSRPAQKELVRVTIENKVGELIRNVGDDIVSNVRDIVKYGYNNNLSQDEIAKEISSKVTSIKNKRARAIARTEIARTATISDYVISAERGATHFYVECRNTACPICKEAWHKGWTVENDDSYNPSDTSAGGKGWIGDRTFKMSQTDKLPPIHPNCRCVPYFITDKDITDDMVEVGTTEPTEPVTEPVETNTAKPKTVEEQMIPHLERFYKDPKDVKIVAKEIQKFVEDSEGLDHEILTTVDTNHKVENAEGIDSAVNIPDSANLEGRNHGLLFGIHNHPDGAIIPSVPDIDVATTCREKVSAIYCYQTRELLLMNNEHAIHNKDGSKISGPYYQAVYGDDIVSKYTESRKKRLKKYHGSKEFKNVQKDYKKGKLSKEEANLKIDEEYSSWNMEHLDEFIDEWNTLFKDEGVEFVRIKLE